MAKAGRKPKEFTPELIKQIDKLALEGHKTGTIAVALGLNEETLKAHYSERMAQKRVEGKILLKRWQIKKARTGDSIMLIWLGKNELEQTDKQDLTHGVSDVLAQLIKEIGGNALGIPIKQ
jgi:hypothetical protein